MQGHYHAAVWIDHKQARVIHFNTEEWDVQVIHPEHAHAHHSDEKKRPDNAYLEKVTKAIAEAGAILVLGPANEKGELIKHIEKTHPTLSAHIEGVESADHPTDGEIAAHARRVLKSAERMKPQL
jgi:hypothetical protein